MTLDDLTFDTTQSIDVKADIGDVFRSVLHRLGEGSTNPQGESMQMTMEQWPGGRWFRDRGNGVGHLWGHVQVIKAPVLLELSGPMFMSYPALNHVEVKLEQRPGGTHVDLRHRAIGFIDPQHRQGSDHRMEAYSGRRGPGCARRRARNGPRCPKCARTISPELISMVCGRLCPIRTRRSILDLLRQGPRTTTEIVGAFPHLTPLRRDEAH